MHLRNTQESTGGYNLARALSAIANRRELSGPERDEHERIKRMTVEEPNGIYIPWSALGTRDVSGSALSTRADLNAGTDNLGKFTVQTDVSRDIIPILRNKATVLRLGAQSLTNLSGNVALPKQTGTATVESLAENTQATASNQTFGQLAMGPKRLCAVTRVSKTLVAQSSADINRFVINDIQTAIAREMDRQVLVGTGQDNQVLGIVGTAGVGSVTFGGAPTRDKLIDFESAVCEANADDLGEMSYLVNAATRTKLKKTLKIASGTTPSYLWDDGARGGTNDGVVNGYRAASSNQLADGKVIFGAFSQVYVGIWGAGMDVVVDYWSLADSNLLKITVNMFFDAIVRIPQAFAVSTDSGAQ